MPDATRTCPRRGCTKTISGDLFACSPHWYSIPPEIRDQIWLAWRAYQRGTGTIEQLSKAQGKAFTRWGQDGPE